MPINRARVTARKHQGTLRVRVSRVATPNRDCQRKSFGVTTGLGVCEYLAVLFEANEQTVKRGNRVVPVLPTKLTDDTIKALVIAEFPGRESIRKLEAGKTSIGYWRRQYNAGRLTQGRKPSIRSQKYL